MSMVELEYQLEELAMAQVCYSNYIVKVFDTFEDEQFLYIIMEFVKGENLLMHLMAKERTEKVIKETMQHLVLGLKYMHSIGIAHRDIKFENIIVDAQSGIPKYIDFGLSKVFVV